MKTQCKDKWFYVLEYNVLLCICGLLTLINFGNSLPVIGPYPHIEPILSVLLRMVNIDRDDLPARQLMKIRLRPDGCGKHGGTVYLWLLPVNGKSNSMPTSRFDFPSSFGIQFTITLQALRSASLCFAKAGGSRRSGHVVTHPSRYLRHLLHNNFATWVLKFSSTFVRSIAGRALSTEWTNLAPPHKTESSYSRTYSVRTVLA